MATPRAAHIECRSVGTIATDQAADLRDVLSSICGTDPLPVTLHEIVLRPAGVDGMDKSASVRLVHQVHLQRQQGEARAARAAWPPQGSGAPPEHCCRTWVVRHEGQPMRSKVLGELPLLVRPLVTASLAGADVLGSWRAIGMAPEYELLKEGHAFELHLEGQLVQVGVHAVCRPAAQGLVSSATPLVPGQALVEAVVVADQSAQAGAIKALKLLRSLVGHLVDLKRPTK